MRVEKQVVNIGELSEALGVSKFTILQFRAGLRDCPLLHGLPEPVMSRPRLMWLVADIKAWLESKRTFREEKEEMRKIEEEVARRKRGRPRKTASVSGY